MNVNNETKSFLKVVILSQLLVEANDDLKNTSAYKQSIKHQVNKTSSLLDTHVRRAFDVVYQNDPEMCTNVMSSIDRIVGLLSGSDIDQLVMIEAIVQAYLDDPEEVNKKFVANFLKLNK